MCANINVYTHFMIPLEGIQRHMQFHVEAKESLR